MSDKIQRPDIDTLATLYNEYVDAVNTDWSEGELEAAEQRSVERLKAMHAAFPELLKYARELEDEVQRLLNASAAYVGGLLAIRQTVDAAAERMTEALHEGTEHWDAADTESR